MLHWLGNQKASENAADVDATAIDAPETPAPVFAVRAFKHAIFGTPQTAQPKPPRRHSNNDTTTRPRQNARPRIERPKSTNDAQTLGKLEGAIEDEPLPSPTKGILLTPGTAGGRRKTVSFGDHVLDNEGKRPMKSGLPDDCPGKFPSPWAQKAVEHDSSDEPAERPRSRSKLTEALEQAREESAKRKTRSFKQPKPENDTDITLNFGEPRSDSGKYWKQEYDIYRERTTREVRKLVKRHKETKDYARQKDDENTDLREELRRERKKVERLERRTAELEAQMKAFQEQMRRAGISAEDGLLDEVHDTVPHPGDQQARPVPPLSTGAPFSERPSRPQRRSGRAAANQANGDQRLDVQSRLEKVGESRPITISRSARNPTQDQVQANPLATSANEPGTAEARPPSPLKSLSINTLAQDTRHVAMSMGLQPPSPKREKRQDSPVRGLESPLPSPDRRLPKAAAVSKPEQAKDDDWSIQGPESSLFEPDAVTERPNILTGAPVPVNAMARPPDKILDLKMNASPTQSGVRNQENEKPSAAWNAMGAPPETRRVVSKENGKPMDQDRLERAKARLAARNRVVS